MNHQRVGFGGGGRTASGMVPALPYLPGPQHRACWKLTHDPHHDVTQNEGKEEDTADDVCAAPGGEVGEAVGWGGGAGLGESWVGVGGCWRMGVGRFYFIFLRKLFPHKNKFSQGINKELRPFVLRKVCGGHDKKHKIIIFWVRELLKHDTEK